MASCDFCKIHSNMALKSCVCRKVSYCSTACQKKDWKTHKPSCPPFIIRESPGKGRGLFATRKIKEGQVILEEYPLLVLRKGMSLSEFQAIHYPNLEEETKAKIMQLNDPADNIKKLDIETVEKLIRKFSIVKLWKEARDDEMNKIFRISTGNSLRICGKSDLYSNTTEIGLFHNLSLINHSCVPNAASSWVMGDFKRQQVRAVMVIEKDEEILISYRNRSEFRCGSREYRRQELLEIGGFHCECSECSLEEEDLEENERRREEFWEVDAELQRQLQDLTSRRSVRRVMKMEQKKTKMAQKLNIRAEFFTQMLFFHTLALKARRMGISCVNEPDIYKLEAWKYAKMFGDNYIHFYNRFLNN